MNHIKKYTVKEPINKHDNQFIDPPISYNCKGWWKGEIQGMTQQDLADVCNRAYTQAIIDVMNGEVEWPKILEK